MAAAATGKSNFLQKVRRQGHPTASPTLPPAQRCDDVEDMYACPWNPHLG